MTLKTHLLLVATLNSAMRRNCPVIKIVETTQNPTILLVAASTPPERVGCRVKVIQNVSQNSRILLLIVKAFFF